MFEARHHELLAFLREARLVGDERLAELDEARRATGHSVVDLVIGRGWVARSELLSRLARHLGCECWDGEPDAPAAEALALLPPELARRYGVLPLRLRGGTLELLTSDPFDPQAAGDLGFALGRPVRLLLADPDRVEALVREHYGENDARVEERVERFDASGGGGEAGDPAAREFETLAAQAPIVRFVDVALRQAVLQRASDIHFEPFEHEFRIRYRIDGALHEMPPPPRHLALPITSRLKVLADLNIAERRLPQDGRIKLSVAGRPVDLRISTLPTEFGESAVLRVLDRANVQLELDQLGLPGEVRAGLAALLRRPHGIFIVTGPTGSGKTTTLYSALRELNQPGRKLLTAEDPVEYEVEGLMQVAVNPAAGLTFASALRAFLRQDPDVIMVGEIRDPDTARIAVQAALTGHLVLTTLHTPDAAGAVTRLIDLGVEPFLISSTLGGVLAQRLVRRICARCRAQIEPPEPLLRRLGVDPCGAVDFRCWRGCGCADCGQTGYRGRLGLFEWMRVTEPLREQISRGVPALDLRRQAVEDGTRLLRDEALAAVWDGATTLEEAARYC